MHEAVPKVSVCIPTYNYARFLPEAIGSVLAQSFTDFELLVVDDCSGDDTAEVVRQYARRDPRIDFRVNPTNLGMVENWNHCLRLARGEYVKFLFGDDALCSPDALRRMAGVLDGDPSVSLVACARNVVDEASRVVDVWAHFPDGAVLDGGDVICRCLETDINLVGEPSAVMFRKAQAMRGFDGRYRQLVDEEMWFHLLERGRLAYIGEPMCAFRRHPRQQTRINRELGVYIDDTILLVDEYLPRHARRDGTGGGIDGKVFGYNFAHKIWKAYRKGMIGRRTAFRHISRHCGLLVFFSLLPFYKLYREGHRVRERVHSRLPGGPE